MSQRNQEKLFRCQKLLKQDLSLNKISDPKPNTFKVLFKSISHKYGLKKMLLLLI